MDFGRIRVGQKVVLRSDEAIAATLDENGTVDGLPFAPEMRQFRKRIMEVQSRMNRVYIDGNGTVRGIRDVVLLRGARCSGAAHGGCERMCLLMFKSAWLEPSERGECESELGTDDGAMQAQGSVGPGPSCRGQTDVLMAATLQLSRWDLRQYLRDIRAGTMTLADAALMIPFLFCKRWDVRQLVWDVKATARGFGGFIRLMHTVLGQNRGRFVTGSEVSDRPTESDAKPVSAAMLQPGEIVEVRGKEEILRTLNSKDKCRGLSFPGTMLKYCGKRYAVLKRIERSVDQNGQFRTLKGVVVLDGVTCDGMSYRGCPLQCPWFWREEWLKRVDETGLSASGEWGSYRE